MDKKESEHDEMLRVTHEMDCVGGAFVKALSTAMQVADKINLEKLKAAFPVYWKTYRALAIKRLVEEK